MTYDLANETDRIRHLQTMLRYISFATDRPTYKVNVSGSFDTVTENAVMSFQAANKLPVTGIADLDTWNAIAEEYERERSLREKVLIDPIGSDPYFVTPQGERSVTVLILQILLGTLRIRYDYAPIQLSGNYDERTADAVRVIQKANSLPTTGNADRLTWQRIALEFNTARSE